MLVLSTLKVTPASRRGFNKSNNMKTKKFSSPFNFTKSRKTKFIPATRSIEALPLTYEDKDLLDEYEEMLSKAGGFDPATAEITPLICSEEFPLMHLLSSLAGAVESGVVSQLEWPQQLFADEEQLDTFLDELSESNERMNDRQFNALYLLCGTDWPMQTNADVADSLRDAAVGILRRDH